MSHKHSIEMTASERADAVARARALAPEFDRVGVLADEQNALQTQLAPLYKEAGLADVAVPKRYGGQGGDIWVVAQISRELAKGDPACALAFNMHQTMVGIFRGLLPEALAKDVFSRIAEEKLLVCAPFSEERAGVVGLADTVARPNADGTWRISGRKTWATLSEAADLLSFNAVVVDDEGILPDDPMTRAMAELAFVMPMDTPGVSIERTWDAMGMRGTGTQTVVFDDAVVPPEANAGPFRNGLFNEFEWAALSFSGVYLGAMEKAYEFTKDVLRTKSMGATMEGSDVKLKNLGYVQQALGEMYVLCRQSAYVVQQMCEDFIENDMAEFSSALPQRLGNLEIGKLTTTENAIKVVDLGMRAIGGAAYRRGHLLERLCRDMRSGPFHVLTTNQIIDQLGRFELGLFDIPTGA